MLFHKIKIHTVAVGTGVILCIRLPGPEEHLANDSWTLLVIKKYPPQFRVHVVFPRYF